MGFIAASCVIGFKQKVSTTNGFRNQQWVFILIMSDIPPASGVIFSLCESDISANAEVILYSPLKLGETQYHLRSKYNWRSQYNSPQGEYN